MITWRNSEDFYLRPNFSIGLNIKEPIPIEFKDKWEKYITKLLISDELPHLRSVNIKKRYNLFHNYENNEDYPPLLLMLSEVYFWLDDLYTCRKLLKKLSP